MRTLYIVLCFLFFIPRGVTAQSISGDSYASQRLKQAEDFLQASRFERAQQLAQDLKNDSNKEISEKATYIEVLAAISLNEKNAMTLVTDFVNRYPTSIASNDIYNKVARTYFSKGQYAKALPWFAKVKAVGLPAVAKMAYNFSYGYSRFAVKDYAGALPLLSAAENSADYGAQAGYYLGYIAYATGDIQKAKAVFEVPAGVAGPQQKSGYYLADIYYQEGDFKKALAAALAYLPMAAAKEASEINKIIGESYFMLGEYAAAIPYLEVYRGQRRRWAPQDYYQLGYCFYFVKAYKKAIGQFNKITAGKDALAQNAYYYLGASYLQQGQKQAALNAFKTAAGLKFSKEIAKEAGFNYAKLSYEVGNPFVAIDQVLTNFISLYPKEPETKELKSLLLNAYLSEKDYKGALSFLERTPSMATLTERQEIAKLAAFNSLEAKDYEQATAYLEGLIAIDSKNKLAAEAYFWQAEIALRTYNYKAAFESFYILKTRRAQLSEDLQLLLPYQQAYAYFKTKEYPRAIEFFKNFMAVGSTANKFGAEYKQALLRTADAYYSLGDFKRAVAYYDQAANASSALKAYATFSKAMALGLQGDVAQKIRILKDFDKVSMSPIFYPKSLFELAESHATQDQNGLAVEAYDKLLDLFPTSALVPEAMLKKGLLLYNDSKLEAALAIFKDLGARFSKAAAFSQALSTAKRIYLEQGRVQDYVAWTQSLNLAVSIDENLDQESYEQIARSAASQSKKVQIQLYEGYIKNFPNGLHELSIRYLLAQAYESQNQLQNALAQYEWVAAAQSENSEAALAAVAKIQMDPAIGIDPSKALKELLEMAQDPKNRQYAVSNLMRLSYEKKDYKALSNYANEVLATEGLELLIKQDAQIMLARAAQAQGDHAAAIEGYTQLRELASGALGAESLYWLAYYKQQAKDYEASNVLVQELAKDYAAYKQWAAMGLLLMADNFYAMEDLFQASFIWQNIADNFSQFPALVAQAQLRMQETKDPASSKEPDNSKEPDSSKESGSNIEPASSKIPPAAKNLRIMTF